MNIFRNLIGLAMFSLVELFVGDEEDDFSEQPKVEKKRNWLVRFFHFVWYPKPQDWSRS